MFTPDESFEPKTTDEETPGSSPSMYLEAPLLILGSRAMCPVTQVPIRSAVRSRLRCCRSIAKGGTHLGGAASGRVLQDHSWSRLTKPGLLATNSMRSWKDLDRRYGVHEIALEN